MTGPVSPSRTEPPLLPRVRAAAIIQTETGVLFVEHEKDGGTYWLLPGGGVDFGESLAEALEREVLEETGVIVETGDLVFANDSIPPDKHRHQINLVFEAEYKGRQPGHSPTDPRVRRSRFLSFSAIETLALYPDIRGPLLAHLRGEAGPRPVYLGPLWKP